MADMTRIKDVLEIAAASPDTAVRRLAMRQKELQAELDGINAFFAVYGSIEDTVLPVKIAKIPPRKPGEVPKTGRVTVDDMLAGIKTIMLRHGPMKLDPLFTQYCLDFPHDAGRDKESFRATLNRRHDVIGRVSETDKRYWPVGAELNGQHAIT
jgi:hypothetical protein